MSANKQHTKQNISLSISWTKLPVNLRGLLLMAVFALLVAITHCVARELSKNIHPMQIAFFRSIIPLILVIPVLYFQGRKSKVIWWRTSRPGLQIIRGIAGSSALIAWWYSISMIPVGDATAISFSVVIFASLGAVIFLGEKMGVHRWSAVTIGFIGTMIIIRPGLQTIELGSIFALGSAVFWASGLVMTKVLSRTDSTLTIVFYSSAFYALFTFPLAMSFWSWVDLNELLLLILVGILAFFAHLAVTMSLKQAEATVVMPMDFTRLLWAAVISYLWFGEFPDMWTWIGSIIVFSSTFYITYRERQRNIDDASSTPSQSQ